MATETATGEKLLHFVIQMLREDQFYMKLERVYDCAQSCKRVVKDYVVMLYVPEFSFTNSTLIMISNPGLQKSKTPNLALAFSRCLRNCGTASTSWCLHHKKRTKVA